MDCNAVHGVLVPDTFRQHVRVYAAKKNKHKNKQKTKHEKKKNHPRTEEVVYSVETGFDARKV